MGEIKRIDPAGLRLRLAMAYGAAPGPPGAGVIVSLMQEFYDAMMGLYESYTTTLFGVEKRQLQRTFRTWRRQARRLGKRIDAYWGDACLVPGECPEHEFPAYTDEWVAGPIIDGKWPDDYYLNVPRPDPERPDAIILATLWNQLIAVQGIAHMVGPIREMLYSIVERAEINLRESAPGEEETAGDLIAAAWKSFREGVDDLVEGFGGALYYVGAGVAIVGSIWLAMKLRKK